MIRDAVNRRPEPPTRRIDCDLILSPPLPCRQPARTTLLIHAAKQPSRGWFPQLRNPETGRIPRVLTGLAATGDCRPRRRGLRPVHPVAHGARPCSNTPRISGRRRQIQITPPPAWIHSDVKTEVIRDAGLPVELSILDERLFDRLKQAFALHPWIRGWTRSSDRIRRTFKSTWSIAARWRWSKFPADYCRWMPTRSFAHRRFFPGRSRKLFAHRRRRQQPVGPTGHRLGRSCDCGGRKTGRLIAAGVDRSAIASDPHSEFGRNRRRTDHVFRTWNSIWNDVCLGRGPRE